jgi:hypothetical protein
MALSSELVGVVAGALAILVGAILVFGHRFSDKSGKFDEKSQGDELNEIRLAMREDTVIKAIDRMWEFLMKTDLEMKKESKMKNELKNVRNLPYDINRRDLFNKLINELEQSFQESVKVKETWLALRSGYGRLGKILYACATVLGALGFPLLCLSSQTLSLLSSEQLVLLWFVVAILGILFLGLVVYTHRQIASNMTVYQAKWRQYRIDDVKVGR